MIDTSRIKAAVLKMFEVNFGLRPEERVVVVSDLPTFTDWRRKPAPHLNKMLAEAFLGRAVADLVKEGYPDCPVEFVPYFSLGRSGLEPRPGLAARMARARVLLAINSFSLSHTEARALACRAGARVATMRGVIPEMFFPDGSIAADYLQIEADTKRWAERLTRAGQVRVASPAGTDLVFSIENREGGVDTGLYLRPGQWGNLPAGEAFIAPLEGTGQGLVAVNPGWHAGLAEKLEIVIKDGLAREVRGGGEIGRRLIKLLGLDGRQKPRIARCNLAEFGLGANPQARRTDITIEAEKIKGTIHLALGDNAHLGGRVTADYHQDYVLDRPEVYLDGEKVISAGQWLI
ncbi:MAG: hypothetical protein AB1641_05430 [Thermodesulfobacteriota bacterium]